MVLVQTKKWEILGNESSRDLQSELSCHHQQNFWRGDPGAMKLFRLLFLFQSMITFLRISFARVLWQFLLPERKRQFQVFLWRQTLLIQQVELQYLKFVCRLFRCSCEHK
ncbi:hypothetical protein COY76_02295 [bacterium CG_4_10_14_0_8_um_filter_33_57]|nr:MAG: hypothetical protein COY76_02295 [bacterium CG_4_10_14_0_8_um_filter_33_57]